MRDVFGFRGPGRFVGAGFGGGAEVVALDWGGASVLIAGRSVCASSVGFHNGHFLASGESSGTSTISLWMC